MQIIQIVFSFFFVFAAVKAVERFRSGELRLPGLALWLLFWLLAELVVVLPNSTFYFARIFGVGRGADLVVYIGMAVIFFLVFKLIIKIEILNKDVTKLTRKIALMDDEKIKK